MDQRFEAEELDADTLAYLRRVVKREGDGMPGVYLDAKEAKLWVSWMPLVGLIVGPVLVLLTFLLTWGSLHEPVGVALLQTAGFLLGGWLIVAFFRTQLAKRRDDYLGYFKFVDPLYVWAGTGTGVWVTPIDLLEKAHFDHRYDQNSNYKGTTIDLKLADRSVSFDVYSTDRGEQVVEFLNGLTEERRGSVVERAYAVREQMGEFDDGDRRVTAIPRPERARVALSGWLPLVIVAAVGVVLFVLCKVLATAARDDAFFDIVHNQLEPDLRSYLLDPRNTRHREAVKQRLRALSESVAQRLERVPGDANLKTGLAELVRAVAAEPRPVVTMYFPRQGKRADTAEGYLSAAVVETMNRDLMKAIGERLTQQDLLGQQLVDFAEALEGPGMMTFEPKVTVPAKGDVNREVRVEWTVTLQAGAEAKKHVVRLAHSSQQVGDDPTPAVRTAYRQLATGLAQRLTPTK